ncbi:MAG: c-type cytochrome [Epsilonproteobacteria bacterium]|nr:hypothetical protein [Campylobacterota bacterium]NPA56837.1 c-type cytochrome [Campylobacterota bacterium]
MRSISLLLLLTALLWGGEGVKEGEGKRLFTQLGCYGCHGVGGVGTNDFPRLAGKPKGYLIDRLREYREEKRVSARAQMMAPFAKNLTDREIEAIADYLSTSSSEDLERYDEEYDLTDPM